MSEESAPGTGNTAEHGVEHDQGAGAAVRMPREKAVAITLIVLGVLGTIALWFLSRPVALLASPELSLALTAAFALLALLGMGLVLSRAAPLRAVAWTVAAVVLAPLFWLFWFVMVLQAAFGDWQRTGTEPAPQRPTGEEGKREPLKLYGVQRTTLHLAVVTTVTMILLGLTVVLSVGPAVRTMEERSGGQEALADLEAGEPVYRVVVQQDPEKIAPLIFDYAHGLPPQIEQVVDMWDRAYRRARAYNATVRRWVAEHGLPPNSALLEPALTETEEERLIRTITEEEPPEPGSYPAPQGTGVLIIGELGPNGVPVSVYAHAEDERPELGWYVPEVYAFEWLDARRLAVATRDRGEPRHRFDIIDLAAEPPRIVYGRELAENERPQAETSPEE